MWWPFSKRTIHETKQLSHDVALVGWLGVHLQCVDEWTLTAGSHLSDEWLTHKAGISIQRTCRYGVTVYKPPIGDVGAVQVVIHDARISHLLGWLAGQLWSGERDASEWAIWEQLFEHCQMWEHNSNGPTKNPAGFCDVLDPQT